MRASLIRWKVEQPCYLVAGRTIEQSGLPNSVINQDTESFYLVVGLRVGRCGIKLQCTKSDLVSPEL